MKIGRLTLQNFRSYQSQHFDFEDRQVIGILGKTGSGKSTIIEAVLYALFGKLRDRSDDGAMSDGADQMIVAVTVHHMGNAIEARRTKRRGQTAKVEVWENGAQINVTGGVRACNQIIIDKLGFNYETFIAISFFRQGKGEEFVEATPAQRRRYLANLLSNDELPQAAETARERQRTNTAAIARIEGEIDAYTRQLEGIESDGALRDQIEAARTEVSDLSQQINHVERQEQIQAANYERARGAEAERQRIRRAIDDEGARFTEAAHHVAEDESFCGRMLQAKSDQAAARQEWDDRKAAREADLPPRPTGIDRLKSRVANAVAYATLKQREADAITDLEGECPTCKQIVDSLHLQSHKRKLQEEARRWSEESDTLAARLQDVESDEALHIAFEQEFRQPPPYDPDSYDERIAEAKARIERNLQLKQTLRENISRLEEELRGIESVDPTASATILSQTRRQLADLRARRLDFETSITSLMTRLETYRGTRGHLEAAREAIQVHYVARDAIKEVVDAFAVKIPAMVIENVLGGVVSYANNLLAEFGSGFQVSIITQAAISSGEMRETLEIEIKKPDGTVRQYESFSGGQRSIINFSLRLAMAQMMAAQSGTPMRSIYLDEVFSGIDAESAQAMMRVIGVLRGMFDQIFMVTHDDAIKDGIPDTIEVTLVNGLSQVA